MAFKGGLPPINPIPVTPPGGIDRGNIVSPFVPEVGGPTQTTPGSRPELVVPAATGLFGDSGISTKAEELRELRAAAARQLEAYQPPIEISGPLMAPEFELGLPQPVGEMPGRAAAVFRAALRMGRVE